MSIDILFSDYVRNVRASALTAPVLAARLEKVAPPDITPVELSALRLVTRRADEIRAVLAERDRASPGKLRPLLGRYTTAWSALHDALDAAARVAPLTDRGRVPGAVLETLFPDGISFTQLDAEAAWSEGERRLGRMRDEGLGSPRRFVES